MINKWSCSGFNAEQMLKRSFGISVRRGNAFECMYTSSSCCMFKCMDACRLNCVYLYVHIYVYACIFRPVLANRDIYLYLHMWIYLLSFTLIFVHFYLPKKKDFDAHGEYVQRVLGCICCCVWNSFGILTHLVHLIYYFE